MNVRNRIGKQIRRLLGALLVVGCGGVASAEADPLAVSTGSDEELAQRARAADPQSLGIAYLRLDQERFLVEHARKGMKIVLGGVPIDSANADAMAADIERRRHTWSTVIRERGSASVAGRYSLIEDTKTNPQRRCHRPPKPEMVTAVQNGFTVEFTFEHAGKTRGVVVESTFVLVGAEVATSPIFVVGRLADSAIELDLLDTSEPLVCHLGLLVKRQSKTTR